MTLREKEKLIRDLKAYGKKMASSKSKSKKELQRAGIIDKNGKLTEPYK